MILIVLIAMFLIPSCQSQKPAEPASVEKVDNAATRYAETLHGAVDTAENVADKANKRVQEINQQNVNVE